MTVVDYSAAGCAYRDFIKDISPGGMFIETPLPFSVGQELFLTFMLPGDGKHIKITGEIVWVGAQGFGVKFRMPKASREETPTRQGPERRKHPRFDLRIGAFVLLNQPVSLVGEVLDVSMGGLSFRCSSEAEIPWETWELDILCTHGGESVGELPFIRVTELPFSEEEKRYGVKFERLTNRQAAQLRAFIEAHTTDTARENHRKPS